MSINGTVTLAISELDSLRNQIKDAENKEKELNQVVANLQEKQKKVLVQLNFTEQTQRQVPKKINKIASCLTEELLMKGLDPSNPNSVYDIGVRPWETNSYNYPKQIELLTYQTVVEERLHNKIEYIGFEEVITDLQLKAEKIVADRITVLTNDNSKLRIENSEIKSANFETNTNIQLAHQRKIEELVVNYDDAFHAHDKKLNAIIKEKDDELAILKGLEVESTKDNMIKDLQAKVAELSKKKSFWKMLFG